MPLRSRSDSDRPEGRHKGDTGATGPAGVVAALSVLSQTAHVGVLSSGSVSVKVPSGTQPFTVTASWGPLTGQWGGYISIAPLESGGKIVGYQATGYNSDAASSHNFTLYVAYG